MKVRKKGFWQKLNKKHLPSINPIAHYTIWVIFLKPFFIRLCRSVGPIILNHLSVLRKICRSGPADRRFWRTLNTKWHIPYNINNVSYKAFILAWMLSLNTINTPTLTLPHVAVDADLHLAQTNAESNLLCNPFQLRYIFVHICSLLQNTIKLNSYLTRCKL